MNDRIDLIKKVDSIFSILQSLNPYPTIELKYLDDFTLLVAIILSAQTTDIQVNKVTDKLFQIVKTPKEFLSFGLEKLMVHFSSLNLYKTKAKHIIETAQIVAEKFNSKVPDDFEKLIELPGVGRKTANVFLGTFHNQHRIGVDTHVTRVTNRLGLCDTQDPKKIEYILMDLIDKKWGSDSHHWLVLHGRYICKAKKPMCDECKIKDFCDFYKKSMIDT
jgi:endonuclease-3